MDCVNNKATKLLDNMENRIGAETLKLLKLLKKPGGVEVLKAMTKAL